jgi:hypothetical protein
MSNPALLREVVRLIRLLDKGDPIALGAIPWASPVLSFGDPTDSVVATLGLNPSNLEFVDNAGKQLLAPNNRFESLDTLNASHWGDVTTRQVQRVWNACENYFFHNPYDQWFRKLDKLLVGTGASYYSYLGNKACHLDLVPFATAEKWSAIPSAQRMALVELGIPSLVQVIKASNIRILLLNGSTVVREFSRLLDNESLEYREMPGWSLQGGRVAGFAHYGRVSRLAGTSLGKDILVLGYNHNIQSSFGVTRDAVSRITTWITRTSKETLDECA